MELDFDARLLFIGLWTLADRDGRLEYRPKRIKMQLFPADDLDIARALAELHDIKLIEIYSVSDQKLIQITNFKKHQNPHPNEAKSILHAPGCDGLCNDGSRNDKSDPSCSLLSSTSIPPPIVPPPTPGRDKGVKASLGHSPDGEQPVGYPEWFEVFWKRRTRRVGNDPKRKGYRAISARRKAGAEYSDLKAGQAGYHLFCKSTNKLFTEMVMQFSTLFGPNEPYKDFIGWEPDDNTRKAGNGTGKESVSDRARRKSDELIAGLGGD